MEHIEIKSEVEEYEEFEYSPNSQQNLETSEDIFCKPFYEKPLDADLNDSEDYLAIPSTTSAQSQEVKRKTTWLDKDCRLLLDLYKEDHPNVGKSFEVKTKRKLWERIAKRMNEQGSHFSASQIEGKFKSLKRGFNIMMENRINNKNRTSCPYEQELSEMFLGQPSTFPSFQFETTAAESAEANEEIMMFAEYSSSEGSDSPPPDDEISLESFNEPPSRPKKARTVLDELKMLRAEFVKERKAKKEYRFAKLNAYKRRTAVLEKQMRLRQDLLMALKESQNEKT